MADYGDNGVDSTRKGSKLSKGLRAAGSGLQQMSRDEMDSASRPIAPVQYRKGGRIGKSSRGTGNRPVLIIAHENERVIPANKRKKVERLMKKNRMSLTNRKNARR